MVYVILVIINIIILFIGAILVWVAWAAVDRNSAAHGVFATENSVAHGVFATATVVFFIQIFINGYCGLVAFSYNKEIKGGNTGGVVEGSPA